MLQIQTQWESPRLLVWAVDESTHRHLPPEQLRTYLGEACPDTLLIESAEMATLDSGSSALSFNVTQAADFLLALSPETAVCPKTRVWAYLSRFVADRIVAGQFYPTIETGDPGPVAVWRVLVTRDEELAWLKQASAALCIEEPGKADQLIESFLGAVTDAQVRRAFSEDSFFAATAARCRNPGSPPEARFLGALLTEDNSVSGVDGAPLEQVRLWVDALQERQISAAFRVGFRLLDPLDPSSDNWRVEFLLHPLQGDSDPIAATRLWELGHDLPPILGRSLAAQRRLFSEQLVVAAEAWPILKQRAIEEAAPIEISSAEAVAFARQWAVRLVDAGFPVTLPKWARDSSSELSIQLALRPAETASFLPPGEGGEGNSGPAGMIGGNHQLGLSALLQFDWHVAIGSMQLSEDQFNQIVSAQRPLVQYNGEWVQVDVDAAIRAMEFINSRKDGQITLAEALRIAHGTPRSQTGLKVSGITGADWIGQLLQQTPDTQVQSIEQPTGFQGTLRPYQLRGLQWLAFLQTLGLGACLADDMGLGKTIQFIALLLMEREQAAANGTPLPGPTLLFAPTSVLGNWSREVSRFAPELKFVTHHGVARRHGAEFKEAANSSDLVVTTYALASRDAEDFRQVRWHRLAMDEAQRVKNPSATSTQAIRAIPAGFRVALTGTPIENHLSELWSIMEILNPGLLGSASSFREQFAVPIERLGDSSRAHHLRELVKPFLLRRTKSDPLIAGELPEKLETKVFSTLTVEQASLYQRITDEMLGHIDAASGIRRRGLILAALTRLKQVCNHPAMLDGKLPGYTSSNPDLDQRSAKCERLIEMLEEVLEEGDSALIFTQFKEMGDLLEKILPRRLSTSVLYLHGGTPAPKRDEMINDFQTSSAGPRIFILSLRAGGLGLNLTRANHVFHFDRWWNPAVEQQATDRAHRIGQSRQVQVHKFVCIGTMEERIDRMISDKMQLADRIITSGDEWLTSLSTEELRRTLQLSPDAIDDSTLGAA